MAEAHREEIAKLEALYAAHPEGRVFTHLAEAYRRAGELSRAREILEDGLRRHPDYSSAHVVYGRVLMDLDETTAAASAFRRVLDLDRHNLVALRSLGDLAEKSGDRAAAIGYYRELIALDPADDRLRMAVTRLEGELAAGGRADATEVLADPDTDHGTPVEPAAGTEPAPEEVEPPEPAAEVSPWHAAGAEMAGAPPLDFPELGGEAEAETEPAEPLPSFPTMEGNEEVEMFTYEADTLEVEGLTLGRDEAGVEPAERPEGFVMDEPWDVDEAEAETAGAEAPAVDDVMEAPALMPDEFAGLGWSAGETADMREEDGRSTPETDPVGDELVVDDTEWASLGERAEAAWSPGDGEAPAAAGEELAEADWGLPSDEAAADEEPAAEPVPEPSASAPDRAAPSMAAEALGSIGGAGLASDGFTAGARPEPPAGEMVTATMAELYAQQGFYDRAVDVYRQLLDQVPEDERLRERLAEVEMLGRAAAEAEESEAEATSAWTGTSGVAAVEETPYAWAGSTTGEEGPGSGLTAGAYFRSLLSWQPSRSGAVGEPAEGVLELGEDALEHGSVELEAGAVAAAFEEWFGEEGGAGEGESPETEESADEDADLAMFRSWLQSLKK